MEERKGGREAGRKGGRERRKTGNLPEDNFFSVFVN